MHKNLPSRAEMFDDLAVYHRTSRGQRELVVASAMANTVAAHVLARVNGYTDLRRLVDLSPEPPSELASAIEQLLQNGLIELVDPEYEQQRRVAAGS